MISSIEAAVNALFGKNGFTLICMMLSAFFLGALVVKMGE